MRETRVGLLLSFFFSSLCFVAPAGAASEPVAPEEPRARAELGGLHRAAASLEAILELYRLALTDILPATRRVAAAGAHAPATSATLLPAPAVEVFTRVSGSLPHRVPAKALPVLARGYHAEVSDALERLGEATQLGHVTAPLRQLVRGIRGVLTSADTIVDLFSRQRPVEMKLVDTDLMLAQISEALGDVLAAEKKIGQLRKKRKNDLGAHFRAFRRLEVMLGHALDLIAVAEEGGLHIGFDVRLPTAGFAALLTRVRDQVDRLDGEVMVLEEPPVAIPGALAAQLLEGEGGQIESRLQWQPPVGRPRAAAVRVYRRPNLPGIQARLAAAYNCSGKSAAEAQNLAERGTQELTNAEELLIEVAAGKITFDESWEELPIAPPSYRVVSVNAFGVEGASVARVADYQPRQLAGASEIAARSLATAADDPGFYRSFDAVEVSWQLSLNDVAGSLERRAAAKAAGLPVVEWYRVLRVDDAGGARNVARVRAGTHQLIDRVPPDELRRGLRYSVETMAVGGDTALPEESCALSDQVRVDLGQALALAQAGFAAIQRPTAMEEKLEARLADPKELARAREELIEGAEVGELEERVAGWWRRQPEQQRRAWLHGWRDLHSAAEREELLKNPPARFSARDASRVQIEVWMAGEPAEVRGEIDRWWALLDAEARAAAVAAWREKANAAEIAWWQRSRADAEGLVDWGALRAVRVLAWWRARDQKDQRELANLWADLDAEARAARLQRWYEPLSPAEKEALHFPDPGAFSPQEVVAWLQGAPSQLPDELWRQLLADLAWRELVGAGGPAALEVAEEEVPSLDRLVARVRFAARPLDLRLGFYLWPAAAVALLVGLLLVVIWRRRRRLPVF